MNNDKIHEEIIKTFFQLHKIFRGGTTFHSKIAQLSPMQMHTLFFLENKKIPVSEISKYFNTAIPTVTELLGKLSDMKLVTRVHSKKDRRIVYISLTESGKKLIEKAKKQRHQKINTILSHLSFEDKEQLLIILKKVTK